MPAVDHSHPVDESGVARARDGVLPEPDAERLAGLLSLLSDPVRLRMLFALVSVEELCVGDVAMALDISMDQSSYGLKLLRSAGLVQTRRDGRIVHHRLAEGFPHQLLEHCLRELLSITKENR